MTTVVTDKRRLGRAAAIGSPGFCHSAARHSGHAGHAVITSGEHSIGVHTSGTQLRSRIYDRGQTPSVDRPNRWSRRGPEHACAGTAFVRESPTPPSRMIVAGFDGTSLGEAAVAEAAVRAGPAGYVFVVCAYRGPLRCLGRPYFDRRLREARMAGQRVLDDLWRRRDTLLRSHLIQQLICGRPAQAIGGRGIDSPRRRDRCGRSTYRTDPCDARRPRL